MLSSLSPTQTTSDTALPNGALVVLPVFVSRKYQVDVALAVVQLYLVSENRALSWQRCQYELSTGTDEKYQDIHLSRSKFLYSVVGQQAFPPWLCHARSRAINSQPLSHSSSPWCVNKI